jgi:hypothetical protein
MRASMQKLFIPAKNRKEAERGVPRGACRFARVMGGFIAFDSEEREGCGVRAGQGRGRVLHPHGC